MVPRNSIIRAYEQAVCSSPLFFSTPRSSVLNVHVPGLRLDSQVESEMRAMQTVVDLGRSAREKRGISLKTPVKGITVICKDRGTLDALEKLQSYVKGELNAWEVGQEMREENQARVGSCRDCKGVWGGWLVFSLVWNAGVYFWCSY